MPTAVETVAEEIREKITSNSTEDDLRKYLVKVAGSASDPDMRESFKTMLRSGKESDCYAINVLAAGMFAVLPGSKYLMPGDAGAYKVNPFLHKLRKAMLGCAEINGKLKENSTKYIFYPEFLTIALSGIRPRVAAIARAHAGMGPKNDELTCLYSLGGYFDKKTSEGAVKVTGSGGTTCIMTARAIYHAAGAKMIGQRVPTVNTPLGMNVELGVPSVKTSSVKKDGVWKEVTNPVVTVERSDRVEFKGGFDENHEDVRPRLELGDIYLIDGDGVHKFLMRGQGALAGHVGIIVGITGETYSTVDGGAGMGAEIHLSENRKMFFKRDVGWTFTNSSSSFSQAEIDVIDEYMKGFQSDSAVVQWFQTNAQGAGYLANYNTTKANYDKAAQQNNQQLAKLYGQALQSLLNNARRLIRMMKANTVGEVRTIQGWWKPDRYDELAYAGADTILGWLGAGPR
jgi:hypothetical protein